MSRLTRVVFPRRWGRQWPPSGLVCLGGEIVDNDAIRILIAEFDMVEGNVAFDILQLLNFSTFILHLLSLEELKHTLAGCRGGLEDCAWAIWDSGWVKK